MLGNVGFFLRFGLPFTRIRWKRSPKAHHFKNSLQSEEFWKRWPLAYVLRDENGDFRIRWCNTSFTTSITHALWGILLYFRCLSFSCGRPKTIRIRYFWRRIFLENGRKTLRFQKYPDTYGGGLKLLNLQMFACKFSRSLFITRTKSQRSRKSPVLHGTKYPHGSFENNILFSAQISLYLGG